MGVSRPPRKCTPLKNNDEVAILIQYSNQLISLTYLCIQLNAGKSCNATCTYKFMDHVMFLSTLFPLDNIRTDLFDCLLYRNR